MLRLFEPHRKFSKIGGNVPNFLIIGAAKSGTTALHEYLDQHPDIYMSPVKEPNFFAFEGGIPEFAGPSDAQFRVGHWRRQQLQIALYKQSITDLHDYRRLFSGVKSESLLGESSASYMYMPEAPRQIREHLPNCKLIAVLRHPAERAYSKFRQFLREGLEPIGTFEGALEAEPRRIREQWAPTWFYKQRGFYYRQLKRYFDIFNPKQIQILLYEEFLEDPVGLLQRIFKFLGIEERFMPDTRRRHNVTREPVILTANGPFDYLLNSENPIRSTVNTLLKPSVAFKLRKLLLRCVSSKMRLPQPEPMPPAIRRHLIAEYRTDILQLQKLIGKDLSGWLL
jgi:hypothetical protein